MIAHNVISIAGLILLTPMLFGEEPSKKATPPDASAQADAMKLIKEVYGREVAAAKTNEQKQSLAEKLLKEAKENDKDPTAEFMLLVLARNIAAQAADCDCAIQVVDETDKAFQIDALGLRDEVLRKCASARENCRNSCRRGERCGRCGGDGGCKG